MHLFASGSNASGQLGTSTTLDAHSFTRCTFTRSDGSVVSQLPVEADIRAFAAGAGYTLLILAGLESEGNELWASGAGEQGQLGPYWPRGGTVGGEEEREGGEGGPVTSFRKVDLGLAGTELEGYEPIIVGASWETTIVVLRRSDGIDADDAVVSLGSNTHGKLGVGIASLSTPASHTSTPQVVPLVQSLDGQRQPHSFRVLELACGVNHILAIVGYTDSVTGRLVRSVYGWGAARHGQLGSTLPDPRSLLTGCQTTPALFVSNYDYFNEHQQPVLAALGQRHTVLLLPDGTLSICGANDRGQLRHADRLKGVKDIGCTWNGTYACLAVPPGHGQGQADREREVICSNGSNDKGQLGRLENEPVPPADRVPDEVLLPLDRKIFDLACGSEHVAVLCRNEGTGAFEVWGWGWNEHGNLGLGHTNDVRLPTMIWPPHNISQEELVGVQLERVWAGSGTTFILCRDI